MKSKPGTAMRGVLIVALLTAMVLAGCGGGSSSSQPVNTSNSTLNSPDLTMALPDSLTGGEDTGNGAASTGNTSLSHGDSNPICRFHGAGAEDPFKNGYTMTRFLVGAAASWQCIANHIIRAVSHFPEIYYDTFIPLDNGGDPSEPTGLLITRDSETQTTLRLYYGGVEPPGQPGFFLSWNFQGAGATGRLIVGPSGMSGRKPEDPSHMRMDFEVTPDIKFSDMVIYFPSNPVITGFRIQLTKHRNGNFPRFLALGRIETKAQFDTDYYLAFPGDPGPVLNMYTVASLGGEGAALALFTGVGVGLNLQLFGVGDSHLGHYLFDKQDKYYFTAGKGWDWVDKIITWAIYKGNRTTNETSTPSLSEIVAWFSTAGLLPADYFTNGQCENVGDDCTALISAIHDDGWAGQEQNQGGDPGDWRSAIIENVQPGDYLASVLPPGEDWGRFFTMSFDPAP